ncbi:MAG: transcriptional repressor LexA [Acidobacteria bacterium]|nr:transcriptional repressor LexA [Acidobacteriota bacterium]MXZ72737.1 transcriptional repressor LexA [Acidobacteriota bacterium]MYD69850.1 transcriptional repressor LexA [Acidobacteriota bacterium]MYJ03726.1 transcriptional repressor LexA [Acidobacteriota bacterium]
MFRRRVEKDLVERLFDRPPVRRAERPSLTGARDCRPYRDGHQPRHALTVPRCRTAAARWDTLRPETLVQPALTRRQRQILDFLRECIDREGRPPSLEEIGQRFGLSSLATVHKHLTNLEDKGFIKRSWNRSRAITLLPARTGARAVDVPLLGYLAAGMPIDAVLPRETVAVPEDLARESDLYALAVRGDTLLEEQIRHGDIVIIAERKGVRNGDLVLALIDRKAVTVRGFRQRGQRIHLGAATPAVGASAVDAGRVQVQGVVIGVMRTY